MSEKENSQGVRVETVRDKCLCDSRRNDFASICFLLPFSMLMIIGGLSAGIAVSLFGVFWGAFALWFLLKINPHDYSFLARDGLYIVRQGWAVRIPWKMIESVQPLYYGRGGVAGQYRLHYREGLVDFVTKTPIDLDPKRDYIFPYSKRAKKIFYRYVKII